MKKEKKGELIFDSAMVLFSGLSEPGRVAGIIQVPFALKNGADELAENPDEMLVRYLLARVQREKKTSGKMN